MCLGVDLNEVARSSDVILCSQAAMHKRAVRPRGRRTLPAYQQYLEQHEETAKVCKMYMWQSRHMQFQMSYVSNSAAPDLIYIMIHIPRPFLHQVFYTYFLKKFITGQFTCPQLPEDAPLQVLHKAFY